MNNISEDFDPYSEAPELKLSISKVRRWTAMTLFCCPSFAQRPWAEMDLEDWQIHAIRAWEISGILAKELYKQRKRLDRSKTVNSDGRSLRKIVSTIDNVLTLIPENGIILKKELYQKLCGFVARDNARQFIAQLLRDGRIFVRKIPNLGRKPSTAYSRTEEQHPH